jgi:hypothetical protein
VYSGTANILDVSGDVKASLGFSSPATGKTAIELTSQSTDTGLTLGTDTTLYRSGAGALKTDGSFTASSVTATAAVVATTTVTATTGLTVSGGGITMNAATQDITLANGGKVIFGDEEIGRSAAGTIGTGSDLETTGMMFAGNIKSGFVLVTVTANVVSSVSVTSVGLKTSAATAAEGDVSVTATQSSTRPDLLRAATVGNFAFSGSNMNSFSIYMFRTNSTNTGVFWIATGR